MLNTRIRQDRRIGHGSREHHRERRELLKRQTRQHRGHPVGVRTGDRGDKLGGRPQR